MFNFILLSQQSWEQPNTGSNIWDMAHILAIDHNVLLINPALDWSSLAGSGAFRKKARRAFIDQHNGQRLVEIKRNFWLFNPKNVLGSYNWLPDTSLYDWLNRDNGQKLAQDIQSALRILNWSSYILLNDNDLIRGYYLKELIQPDLYIYYLRDNLLATTYWNRHGGRLEPLLMAKVDLIANNSVYLTNQALRYNANAVYIGQGCDLTLFDPANVTDEPADLAPISRPRIGYTGALTSLRLDVDLIEALATRQPNWQLVLIGTMDESFPKERLNRLANITFLEAKPMNQLPAYLAGMDVLMNPQVLNEVTIGNYPRKIDEYLAMGKPVVALKTDAMSLFSEHVYLAESVEDFITGIANGLENDTLSSSEARTAFALTHSWQNSVDCLLNAVDALLMTKSKLV